MSKHRILHRKSIMQDPETGKEITIDLPIYRTIRPTRPKMGIISHDGDTIDYSNLEYVEGIDTIPADVEVVLMSCDDRWPWVPVRFEYEDIGNYRGIWVRRKDLTETWKKIFK